MLLQALLAAMVGLDREAGTGRLYLRAVDTEFFCT